MISYNQYFYIVKTECELIVFIKKNIEYKHTNDQNTFF